MHQLLTAKDLAERYHFSEKTARRYMRKMEHMEKPLRVTDQAVLQWELDRTMGLGYDLLPIRKKVAVKRVSSPVTISKVRPVKKSADVAASTDRREVSE